LKKIGTEPQNGNILATFWLKVLIKLDTKI